ncbi:hypothetical protein Tco_0824733 [Tanacetum coccineum]|uniref:Uncharacterized protein n=1 Tax=Tanacetum coccineum TaxID=301880 RepID=A0ABQ5ARM0_9ASTR
MNLIVILGSPLFRQLYVITRIQVAQDCFISMETHIIVPNVDSWRKYLDIARTGVDEMFEGCCWLDRCDLVAGILRCLSWMVLMIGKLVVVEQQVQAGFAVTVLRDGLQLATADLTQVVISFAFLVVVEVLTSSAPSFLSVGQVTSRMHSAGAVLSLTSHLK